MSKKYIIEIKPEYEDSFKGLMILGTNDSNLFVDTLAVENLEELNSDYINEHFGDLQDEAYKRGLDDAWEAARKIVCDEKLDWNTLLHLFNRSNFEDIFGDFSPSEAIDKLKSYKEKQKADDEIKVGDEVEVAENGIKFFVTKIYDADGTVGGINKDGEVRYWSLSLVKCTGRHFDIPKILAEMRT